MIPVMFFTAMSSKDIVERCMAVGMVDYIVKPYKPEELLDRLEKFFVKTTYTPPEISVVEEAEEESNE